MNTFYEICARFLGGAFMMVIYMMADPSARSDWPKLLMIVIGLTLALTIDDEVLPVIRPPWNLLRSAALAGAGVFIGIQCYDWSQKLRNSIKLRKKQNKAEHTER